MRDARTCSLPGAQNRPFHHRCASRPLPEDPWEIGNSTERINRADKDGHIDVRDLVSEEGLSPQINAKDRVGYTTRVQAKDPSKPLKVYANFPCTPANELKRGGKPVEIPAGEDVKFRYTPDGKHAVVLADSGGNGKDGTWGIVPLEQLNVPKGTPGSDPVHHPIR